MGKDTKGTDPAARGSSHGRADFTFPPGGVCLIGDLEPPPGGVATYCRFLADGLVQRGWRVTFLDTNGSHAKVVPDGIHRYEGTTPRRSAYRALLALDLRSVHVGTDSFDHLPSLTDRLVVAGLRRWFGAIFRAVAPALVHTCHAGLRSLAALSAAAEIGVPTVVTIFGSEFTSPLLKRYLPVARFVCHHATVVAISRHTAAVAKEQGVPELIRVVYPGIDTRVFASASVGDDFRRRYGLETDQITVLYAGWLVERKGPQVLIRALARLPELTRQRLQVFLVGPDHGMLAALRSHVASHGWTNVRVVGEVPPQDLPRFYSVADVLVFPTITRDEGFGLVAVEAAAAGCGVIGSRIGAIPEVVADGENGVLFTPDSDSELAALLERVASDRDLVVRWRRAGPRVAAGFDYRETVSKIEEVYKGALVG